MDGHLKCSARKEWRACVGQKQGSLKGVKKKEGAKQERIFGHVIRHDSFHISIVEGNTE